MEVLSSPLPKSIVTPCCGALPTNASNLSSGLRSVGSARLFHQGLRCKKLVSSPEFRGAKNAGSVSGGVLRIRCAAAEGSLASAQPQTPLFGTEQEFTGILGVVRGLPAPVRFLVCAAIIAGSAGTGYAVGSRVFPPIGQIVGSVVLGALGAGASHLLNESRKEVAAIELHNAIVNHPDISSLQREEIVSVADRYGVSVQDSRFVAELKDLYDRYVTGIIPPGNENLNGNEVELIKRFKYILGLEDDDAAHVHIEIGRRIFRQRLETGDRETAVEERKTFQKLVYVSNLVFGEASKFLLPWKRVFKITDSQVEVAVRSNAQTLFQTILDSSNAEPDIEVLKKLRDYQLKYKLDDEYASEMFRTLSRKKIESYISSALEILKSRTRIKNTKKVVADLEAVVALNDSYTLISQNKDIQNEILPGVGPVTINGGVYDNEKSMDDLKLLYQGYLNEALNEDSLSPHKVQILSKLSIVFGLGVKETEQISSDVTAKVYRRKLSLAVTSRALDEAPSKAAFLEELCDSLNFDPEKAFAIHEEIYRQKLEQCLEDKALDEEDSAALLRLRVLLCVPQKVVDDAHKEICGKIFSKVIADVMSTSSDGYGGDMKKTVQETLRALRLSVNIALEIAKTAIKGVFLSYVKRVRGMSSRTEAGRELKKLVIFSNLTVADLLDNIREAASPSTQEEDANAEEKKEESTTEEDEGPEFEDEITSMQSFKKTRGPPKEGRAQKEVNIADEVDVRDRMDLYRTFLMYCLQGETANMPMGASMVIKRDTSDFARLGQLGDILGLTGREIASVHQALSEQAFKSQAETLLADGQLSKARVEQLKTMQQQFGLPDAAAQKVIQAITSSKMAGSIDRAVQSGRLTVDDIRELKSSGVNIESMVNANVRQKLFRNLVEKALSAGNGEFDEVEICEKLPVDLALDVVEMKKQVSEIASEKLKGSLVQAVALLRQRRPKEVIAILRNMLACDKAERAKEPLTWAVREELADLYGLFLTQSELESPEATRLLQILDIDEGLADTVVNLVRSGGFSLDTNEESFVF